MSFWLPKARAGASGSNSPTFALCVCLSFIIPQGAAHNIDLDDLFNDIYYMDFPGAPPGSGLPDVATSNTDAKPADNDDDDDDDDTKPSASKKRTADDLSADAAGGGNKELTEQQKIERRERNREHAKRSRLRKKFLLESLQEQIHGLEEQIEGFKQAIKREMPVRAEEIIKSVCGDKEKYTPLPMPSGFGPVKTLMEPDFRLSKFAQSFLISCCYL